MARQLGSWAGIAAGVLAGGLLLDAIGLPSIAAGVLAGGLLLDAIGLPSSYLFAALLVGLALARPGELSVPTDMFRASQAVAGVALGAYLEADSLRALASSWLPVALVSLATLGLSLVCGAGLVAFMRYLRVLVVLLTPVGIAVLFGSPHEGGGTAPGSGA